MTRKQQSKINDKTIHRLASLLLPTMHAPSYARVVAVLNAEGYRTSRGNEWTPKRLFRMLQRQGYSGLWGLRRTLENPDYKKA